ncbi:hypothetical protein PCANC_26387 [Puccinia coronata f. sp. avenae]|uniref:Uncharacterized protein n=1 Tax=Puccinia coronata f. sp. avenae TaxID=200324 RepID=A0A2N5TMV1_9BASI|nr:hypothetical protein PCANC_26387 [Puccinia coronata f. sp. avenae]
MFDWWSDRHCPTEAPAGRSDRPVQSVPGTGRTGPAGTGRTNLSNQLALALVGQCPSDHRSNTAVRAPRELPCLTAAMVRYVTLRYPGNFSNVIAQVETLLRYRYL